MSTGTTPAIRWAWRASERDEIRYIETRAGRDYRETARPGVPLHETLSGTLAGGRDSRETSGTPAGQRSGTAGLGGAGLPQRDSRETSGTVS